MPRTKRPKPLYERGELALVRRPDRKNLQIVWYLRASVATWARPEEIFDLGPGQWAADAGVLDLNPPGRRQTKKYRTQVPVPRQFAPFSMPSTEAT